MGYLHAVNSSGILCKHMLWRTPWVLSCFTLPNICSFVNQEHDQFPYTALLCMTKIKIYTNGEDKLKCLSSIQHHYTIIGELWAFFAYHQESLIISLEGTPSDLLISLINIESARQKSTFCHQCNQFSPQHTKNQFYHLGPHWGGFFHLQLTMYTYGQAA